MKNLKQDILDALHDATNLDNGRVSVPYFTELLDGILTEKCITTTTKHNCLQQYFK